jgi:hypothetical protein
MRLEQYLTEKFWDTMENRWGKTEKSPTGYNEIFMNASDKEIREMDRDGFKEFAVILVDDKRALCFGSHILHQDVMDYFGVSWADGVTIRVIFTGAKNVRIEVSETMNNSKWSRKHSSELEEYIRNHGYLKRFKIMKVDMRYVRTKDRKI